MNNNFKKINTIIDALALKTDEDSVRILDEVGTNSSVDEIREMTARALVRKNSPWALSVVIVNKGKGINDMSTVVAMSAINELLSLPDKTEAIKILENTIDQHSEEDVRDNARSVKALMALS